MEVVGRIAIGVVAVLVVAGALIGVMSIPDAKRYMKIRRM